jgi:Fe2+ or Zn2+ uptake regulation protein
VELAEEIIGHHHHLVCTQCGTVADFTVPEAAERALRDALQRIAREGSFVPEDHRLDVLGRCRPCSREHTTK